MTPRDDTDDAHRAGAADPAEPTPGSEADEDGTAGFDEWRRRSAVGDVGTAIARGLGAVFDSKAAAEDEQPPGAPPPEADSGNR